MTFLTRNVKVCACARVHNVDKEKMAVDGQWDFIKVLNWAWHALNGKR